MRCLSYEGGKFVEGIAVQKWAAKWLDRVTKELKTGTEKSVVAVGLDGGLGSASRQQRLSLCDRMTPEVKDGRVFEGHPVEIPAAQSGRLAFTVLRKVTAETRWNHATLMRVLTRIEFSALAGMSVQPWGGKVELAAHEHDSQLLISGTIGPWDDVLLVLYPGDVVKVTAGVGRPAETAIVNDLHRGINATPWAEYEAQRKHRAELLAKLGVATERFGNAVEKLAAATAPEPAAASTPATPRTKDAT